MGDCFRLGDIVKAKVVSTVNSFGLSAASLPRHSLSALPQPLPHSRSPSPPSLPGLSVPGSDLSSALLVTVQSRTLTIPFAGEVLADVSKLSLGDARSYYLSTAANELGVVYATSEIGKSS